MMFILPMIIQYSCFLAVHFFFNDTATTEIYTLSLHDALPICGRGTERARRIKLRVVVLRRERRHGLEAVGRPAHEVQPGHRQAEAAAGADLPGHVVA